MVAYSFKARFVAPILAGTKRQTVRANRKRHARPGETLQFYTGMRTKACRLIMKAECVYVGPIVIDWNTMSIFAHGGEVNANDFAISDGFDGLASMRDFWRDEHPGIQRFEGVLIRWKPLVLDPCTAPTFATRVREPVGSELTWAKSVAERLKLP